MFVPLPNLDDRRFTELVEQGRSLIPVYAPSWTDHNEHDPGITLLEVLAFIAETGLYRIDRIPDRHVRAFLALVDTAPGPAEPASCVVAFGPSSGKVPTAVPAGTELLAKLHDGTVVPFTTEQEVLVQPATLAAVQIESGGRFRDLTGSWARGTEFALFGDDPAAGDAVYFGFDGPFTAGTTLRVELELAGEHATASARRRLLAELEESARRAGRLVRDGELARAAGRHHDASVIWETLVSGSWHPLPARDETRATSLSGSVALRFASLPSLERVGAVDRSLYYVRARLGSGRFDLAPRASRVTTNATRVTQAVPLCETWTIARGVVALGTPPAAGHPAWLSLEFDGSIVAALQFAEADQSALPVRLLSYRPATDVHEGQLVVEAALAGVADGSPHQRFALPGPHVIADTLELWTLEGDAVVRWERRASLRASGPAASDFELEPDAAAVCFGDGQNGRVPPPGARVIARARRTYGTAGNVPAGAIVTLAPALGPTQLATAPKFTNPAAAAGGSDPESTAHAEGRALAKVTEPFRAVTLADFEQLALETPGVALSRAAARENHAPGLDCVEALGMVTVVIVPFLPRSRPVPSAGALRAVAEHLEPRRVLGTRIAVTGPEYVEIVVSANVKATRGADKLALEASVEGALRSFIDPLAGGPDGAGWPLGRDVYISEVLAVLAGVPGVDHVESIALTVPGCEASCGDVCVRPLALAVSGAHQIVVS